MDVSSSIWWTSVAAVGGRHKSRLLVTVVGCLSVVVFLAQQPFAAAYRRLQLLATISRDYQYFCSRQLPVTCYLGYTTWVLQILVCARLTLAKSDRESVFLWNIV